MAQQYLDFKKQPGGGQMHPDPDRRRAASLIRTGIVLSGSLSSLLGAVVAQAVVTLPDITSNLTSAVTLPVQLNQGYWTDFSVECLNAGGAGGGTAGCGPSNPLPAPAPSAPSGTPDALLFSWGGYDQTFQGVSGEVFLNSVLRVKYSGDASAPGGPQAFTLDTLKFTSQGGALGPQGTFGDQPALLDWPVDQGQGTMVAYEVSGSENLLADDPAFNNPHYVTDQLMAIRVLDQADAVVADVRDWMVARPESESGVRNTTTDFFDGVDPNNPTAGEGFPDYRFVGDSGVPADGKTFFFTDKGGADPLLDTRPTDTPTTVAIQPGYTLEFQFYEAAGRWNNETSANTGGNVVPPPDAYYGSFDLTITPAAGSELVVTPDPTLSLPDARAGDPTATTGSIQVENVGQGVIVGEFAELTGNTTEIGPAGTQSFSLGASATDQRDYTFDASGVIFDVSDAGSTGKTFTVTQDITSDADVNPNQTRTVEATAKSPILGVSNLTDENPETDDPNDWAFYAGQGNTIDLGAITVDDDFVIRDLILGNLFGAVDGTLTELTFYNAAITADPNGFFAIVGGDITSAETLQAAQTRSAALQIRFDPGATDIGTWTAQLDFLTDMYREHGVGAPGASTLSFTLRGTLREAPSPGVLALIGIGLVPLLAARRRAATTPRR